MKKTFMILIFIFSIFMISCTKEEEKVKLLVPSGTPLISVGGLYNNDNFSIEIANGQDGLVSAFSQNEYDFIIAPINLGAKLYTLNKTNYKLDAIITLNNAYLVSKTEITDFNNKNVLAFGMGQAPQIALQLFNKNNNYNMNITMENSVSDVSLKFLSNDDYDLYLLSEPNLTKLKESNTIYTYDLKDSFEDGLLIQACLFVNPNKELTKYIDLISNNISSLNEDTSNYVDSIIDKNSFFTSLGKDVLLASIPNTSFAYKKARDNKDIINKYFEVLNNNYSNILNGMVPDESFYY